MGLGAGVLLVLPGLTDVCPLPSRAVQRSLAIVRQARQRRRRRKEEYCMYYNRFGRCNRGEHCPYIHDPEKVAVCTRCAHWGLPAGGVVASPGSSPLRPSLFA